MDTTTGACSKASVINLVTPVVKVDGFLKEGVLQVTLVLFMKGVLRMTSPKASVGVQLKKIYL